MRRAGNLYHQIAEMENLEVAFWKAQRGKSGKSDVRIFREHLHENLQGLREELLSGDVRFCGYHTFMIRDPKERMICAVDFRERVLHHAIINVCEPVFESYQIYDSYACRKGKGMDPCLNRARSFCGKYGWYLKLDVHKYFDSVHHDILLRLLGRRFKDADLLHLFSRIVESYELEPDRGLPIGNLTSQYFANLYLGSLDHVVKEVWRVPGYVRYMDDMVLFGDDKKQLTALEMKVREYLREALALELNPSQLNRTSCGVPYLSYRIHSWGLRLSEKAKRRFRQKIAIANRLESSELALPLLAFVNRAVSSGFLKSIFKEGV